MAAEHGNRACSENQIQSVVRGILGQLFQERPSPSVQHATVNSEINRAFRLPRNSNTSPLTVEGEPQTGPSEPSQPVSLPQQPLSVPSFNSHLNYGNVMGRRPGPIRPRRSGNRRHSAVQSNNRCSSTQSSSSDRNELFLKDVYLLPRPTYDRVPRREAKANLQKEGFCIDAYTFDKRWNEQIIREKMVMLFQNILKDEKSFEFVKSSGTTVIPVNLPSEQRMTGKVLKHVAGNGPVYIRSCTDVEFQLSEEGDDEILNTSGISTSATVSQRSIVEPNKTLLCSDIRNYIPQPSSSSSLSSPACLQRQNSATDSCGENLCRSGLPNELNYEPTTSQLQHISEMFPFLDHEMISKALLDSNMNVEVSIDKLLGMTEGRVHDEPDAHNEPENITDDEIWDTPIATPVSFADNPLTILKRFTRSAVNTFGEEMDVVINRNKDILQQVVRRYKHPEFDITKSLNVSFVNEPGVDAGGLTRQKGHLLPMHNYDLVSGGLFVIVGRMVLHAILNNCTGVPGLSPGVIAYIASGSRDAAVEHLTLEDVPDPVLQDKLHQVKLKELT
ncbi:uncharacterized protein LOC114525067 [Dendronephthya gigantea]|uniref:uncharacterized protein LOC114525067 n=1 Tax=Dendronephthya gigantea TaxID=151771 RepID=UPI001069D232|nr:uncharacterized protein LOC114525067 [Dendronephthya gigantea]